MQGRAVWGYKNFGPNEKSGLTLRHAWLPTTTRVNFEGKIDDDGSDVVMNDITRSLDNVLSPGFGGSPSGEVSCE